MAEFFPQVFYKRQDIKEIVCNLLNKMKANDPIVVECSLNILKNITEGLVATKNEQSLIGSEPMILLQPMVAYFEMKLDEFQKEKEKDNREKAVIIIMNCLMKSKDRQVATHLIEFLMKKYYSIYEINHEDVKLMIESILAIMHTAILALEGSLTNPELLSSIYNLLKTHIAKYGI